jgi:lambda family phage portal protein
MWPFNAIKNRASKVTKVIRAIYDAAQTTSDNRKHWANADALSADAACSSSVRKTVRERARYEYANNSYVCGMVQTLTNDIIGTGPRLQMKTKDPLLNAAVEREYAKWCKRSKFNKKLRVMRNAKTVDGETFGILTTNEKLRSRVKLDVNVVEADRVANPYFDFKNNKIIDGIEFDEYGNPSIYHVMKSHPGDMFATMESMKVPSENMIHWFSPSRPEQHRGVSEIVSTLPLFSQMRRYTLAVVSAAENLANIAIGLKTNAPPDGEASDEYESMDAFELPRNMVTVLPSGWDLTQADPVQPTTTYPQFKSEILKEVGRCKSMPKNIMTCDSSGYNYASGRLDHQTYFKAIAVERSDAELEVTDVVFEAFCAELMLSTEFAALRTMDEIQHQWFYDGREHVDPLKEAQAQDINLENNSTTLAFEYGKRGLDWETEVEQRIKEKAKIADLHKKYKLTETPKKPVEVKDEPEESESITNEN